jgi:hypothetical protein
VIFVQPKWAHLQNVPHCASRIIIIHEARHGRCTSKEMGGECFDSQPWSNFEKQKHMKTHLRYFLGLVFALGLFATTLTPAKAFVGISVGIAPPPLPVYLQPACPGLGYIWTPGYWAWDPDADQYYWVPGAWVVAPEVGFLWTPGWWGWADGSYCFHSGYWGPQVGFYGGIAYGHGYYGHGYNGGYWHGSHFYYNRAANNVSGIAASRTFLRGTAANTSRVSYNGGRGGTTAAASTDERRAESEHHIRATTAQNAEARSAMADPAQRYSVNHGNPQITGTTRAGSFHGTSAGFATGTTRGEGAFTGESRTASSSGRFSRSTGESTFTGESRTASSTGRFNRSSGESAFTGESQTAAEHRPQIAGEERHAAETRSAEATRTASIERSHVGASHLSALGGRDSSYHPSFFHQPAFHSSGFSHAGGPRGGGGGGFAHASAPHVGGGGGAHNAGAGGGGRRH